MITEPGTYRILGDIQGSPGSTCIDIRSSDVLIRGGGHTLNGTATSLGIGATASSGVISNVTVRNLTLTNWGRGIAYENVTGGAIENSNRPLQRNGRDNLDQYLLDYASTRTMHPGTV